MLTVVQQKHPTHFATLTHPYEIAEDPLTREALRQLVAQHHGDH